MGAEVAEAAAHAAVMKHSDMGVGGIGGISTAVARNIGEQGNDDASRGASTVRSSFRGLWVDANPQTEKEEVDVETAISHMLEVQMKAIIDKAARFGEIDLQMEKEFK